MANRPPGQPAHIQPEALVAWLREHLPATGRLVSDSRRVHPGDAFFALAGHRLQGSAFIAQALDKGAAAVVFGVSARPPVMLRLPTLFRARPVPVHRA